MRVRSPCKYWICLLTLSILSLFLLKPDLWRERRANTGEEMSVMISMLRGVNVGGNNKIKMTELKALYESLGFIDVQTYIQSGNVVFKSSAKDSATLGKKIGTAIEKKCGFCPEVIVRTPEELREVIARNPFSKRKDIEPGKLLVMFLAADPGDAARKTLKSVEAPVEEIKPLGKEIYIYFPDGQGQSKLKFAQIDKAINKTAWTGRNWNTVLKLAEMCD
jgi:uncharacterized protein (DUF1697 family)